MSEHSTRTLPAISSKDSCMRPTDIARRPPIGRIRRLRSALAMLAAVGAGTLGVSTTPALAGGCANEQLRSENKSTRLPECRAYEMVTPLYKEGFRVGAETFSDEGAVAYVSTGNLAGATLGVVPNQYVATRSSAGWTTTSLAPPLATYSTALVYGAEALSADLRSSLWDSQRGEPPVDDGAFYYLRGPDGSMTRVGNGAVPGVNVGGPWTQEASADLSHIVFAHGQGIGNAAVAALYEYVGTGHEGPPLSVSVDNNHQQMPGEACPKGMSTDGRVIVFGCVGNGESDLWARVGESATVAVARSECTRTSGDPGGVCNGPAGASFAGMATDGSRVYFTTTQQLVNGDIDQTSDLYECDIPPGAPAPVGTANLCSSLTEVSGNVTGANVEDVVNVSEDGSRAYFVATGVLAANLGINDAAAVTGDNNLYVWQKDAAHPAGQATFVAKLEVNDISRAQSTAAGRYLVFDTANKLLASDTDEATDVYRYDAQTRVLLRLSTDTSGAGGDTPGFNAELAFPKLPPKNRQPHMAMTDDGSTVIFETSEALSPADTDSVTDVYEWHEGEVSLVSSGGATANGAIGITPSGQDIFFETAQPLAAGDSGTEVDAYDARVEGGFPASTPEPCSGEACHGALALQPQVPGASGSATMSGAISAVPPETPPSGRAKPKPPTTAQKLAKALKACRSKHNRRKRKACEKRARNTYRRAK